MCCQKGLKSQTLGSSLFLLEKRLPKQLWKDAKYSVISDEEVVPGEHERRGHRLRDQIFK